MKYAVDALIAAHRHSSHHRDEIARSTLCGCFFCESTYEAAAIVKWTDNGECAICPTCGIDSVIGDASGLPVSNPEFLHEMNLHWFGAAKVANYWFARYTLVPNRGRAIKALTWQGRATIAVFVVAMVGGGLIFAALAFAGQIALGIVAFVLSAIAGAAFFIWAAVTRSDPARTVADYQNQVRLV